MFCFSFHVEECTLGFALNTCANKDIHFHQFETRVFDFWPQLLLLQSGFVIWRTFHNFFQSIKKAYATLQFLKTLHISNFIWIPVIKFDLMIFFFFKLFGNLALVVVVVV